MGKGKQTKAQREAERMRKAVRAHNEACDLLVSEAEILFRHVHDFAESALHQNGDVDPMITAAGDIKEKLDRIMVCLEEAQEHIDAVP